jgi:glycosyltransferase involved in cell wall biosynthesis
MADEINISIVIPLFNEETSIELLYNKLIAIINDIKSNYEIVFVDDGSFDNSFEIIKKLSKKDKCIRGLSLSRNFGHQVALLAGIEHSGGNAVITMDADLQHPPEVIKLMYNKYLEGYDVINTRRIDSKKIGFFKKISSKYYYKLINILSNVKIETSSSDFRLMNRKAINAFIKIRERDRFTRGLVSWMGFKQTTIEYHALPRLSGKSKYTFRKMTHFALDGITSFSSKPLRLSFYLGLIVFFVGFIYAIYAIIKYYSGTSSPGWASILISVLIIGGIQLLSIGIIGEYIARIFNESKGRPIYFIKEKTDEF